MPLIQVNDRMLKGALSNADAPAAISTRRGESPNGRFHGPRLREIVILSSVRCRETAIEPNQSANLGSSYCKFETSLKWKT